MFTPGTNSGKVSLPVPARLHTDRCNRSLIYTGGGADITGGILTDTTNSFVFDPVLMPSLHSDIPRATATHGLTVVRCVLGGAFNTIQRSGHLRSVRNVVSLKPFVTARRNASDTDGTTNIWLAGGDIAGPRC